LYQLQDEVSHYDRKLLQQPIKERYQLSKKQKIEWIEQTTKTLYHCMVEHHKNMTSGQKDIRQFLYKKDSQ